MGPYAAERCHISSIVGNYKPIGPKAKISSNLLVCRFKFLLFSNSSQFMDVDNGTNGTVRHDGNSEEGICRYSLRFPARYLARYRRIGDSDGVDDAANSEQDDGIADADDHDNESSFVGNEAALHALTAEILQYVDELCASHNGEGIYIWQREPFSLHPADSATSKYSPKSKTDVAIARLEGSTRTGESVEDEWWIVYLLLEISKKWPDVAIDIHDSDGQFLLIEAADVLPSWITPENAANRVWQSVKPTIGSHTLTCVYSGLDPEWKHTSRAFAVFYQLSRCHTFAQRYVRSNHYR